MMSILTSPTFAGIPRELNRLILEELDFGTLRRICLSPPNRRISSICREIRFDNNFWQRRFEREILPLTLEDEQPLPEDVTDWYKLYRDYYYRPRIVKERIIRRAKELGYSTVYQTPLEPYGSYLKGIEASEIPIIPIILFPLNEARDYLDLYLRYFNRKIEFLRALPDDLKNIVGNSKDPCYMCGSRRIRYYTRQVRSADEPENLEARCLKCGSYRPINYRYRQVLLYLWAIGITPEVVEQRLQELGI